MCGIVGVVGSAPVNQLLYDALLLLQHRGQDAAGIVTLQERKFHMHKAKGMVRDVFRTRNMRALPGGIGLGQVRYPTAGNAWSEEEAQPFYVNAPYGVVLVHNGNLTNAHALRAELFSTDHRHTNTESDSEVLLNVLAHEIDRATRDAAFGSESLFAAVRRMHRRLRGSYAVVALIAGHGLLALRDPFGIRPLCIGPRRRRRRHGGERVGRAGRFWLCVRARHRAGRSRVHRPAGAGAFPAVRRVAGCCTRASSSSCTWRGPTRRSTASRSTRRA